MKSTVNGDLSQLDFKKVKNTHFEGDFDMMLSENNPQINQYNLF